MKNEGLSGASFRDPSGFIFRRRGKLYRQVNQSYQADYDVLMQSGLYGLLTEKGWLIPHKEVDEPPLLPDKAFKVLQPDSVPFISYPYEWSFSQLKSAAMRTLAVQKRALEHGLSLKDASAYNIQYIDYRPILIDTLSFERYQKGEPWTAYRQFCQHFLAPLALMAYKDIRLSQLLRVYIDGVPLDLASGLLPGRTRLNFGLTSHIHLHAAVQNRYADKTVDQAAVQRKISKTALLGLIDSLGRVVKKLEWEPEGTEWAAYYADTNYQDQAMAHKRDLVSGYLERTHPGTVWDLGANTGLFSRLASQKGSFTVAFDIDPAAVELNYRSCRSSKEHNLLPLILDLTNPSPAIGWQNQERSSFRERGPVDLVLALALIHHLAISNNVPLEHLAAFFASITRWLVIEFVPKSDSQVERLLSTRLDIFDTYDLAGFEAAFSTRFKIHESVKIRDSQRTLYLMESLP